MFRRTLGAAGAVALLATGVATAVERPRESCARRVVDDEGDAKYTLSSVGNLKDPRDPSVAAIDVLSVTLRHTGTVFEAHLRLKDLAAAFQQHETAYRWDVRFKTADDTEVLFQTMRTNETWDNTPLRATGASQYPRGQFAVGSTTTNFTDVLADVDPATGWIVFTVPAAEFAKAFSGGAEGATVTGITAETFAYIPGTGASAIRAADTATSTEPARGTWRVGDDYCFGPPPAALTTTLTAPKVAYGDALPLTATLRNEAGQPLAGKRVTFAVSGERVLTATTDAQGLARAVYTPAKPAGRYPLTVEFAGDATDGKARLAAPPVTVVTEATRLSALTVKKTSASGRAVGTTLTDDDGKPLGGQPVVWYAAGKKAATTTTNARGVATWTGAKAGQSVVARFAGAAGRYAAAASKARTV
jgi:hypothetical protein